MFGVPKEKTVELKQSPFTSFLSEKPVFGFNAKKEEEKPKEEKTVKENKSLFGSSLSNPPSLFGGASIEPSKSLFNAKTEGIKENKPIAPIVEEKKEKESSNSLFNPPSSKEPEKKPITFDPPSSGSLFTASNPFLSAASSAPVQTSSIFSAPSKPEEPKQNLFNNPSSSSLFNSSTTSLFSQPKQNGKDDMQSSTSLNTPETVNLFGNTSNATNNVPSGSLFSSNNTNSLFGNSSNPSNSLFNTDNNNTSNSLFGNTTTTTGGLFGASATGNSLFPTVTNSNALGVPQTNLFDNKPFQIGISKPVFNMGKK